MSFFQAKLNRKLTTMCLILAALICIACLVSGFVMYRDSVYQSYNGFAYELGNIALEYVNGDTITDYLGPDYKDPVTGKFKPDVNYMVMQDAIYQIYMNTTLHEYSSGIYICVPEKKADGSVMLTNIFDVRIVNLPEEKKDPYRLGVVDPATVSNPDNLYSVFETGELSDDYFIHKSSFGYNSTAILPVKDSSGNTVALLMADMPIPYITGMIIRFLTTMLLVTSTIVVIFVSLFIAEVRRSIVKPLQIINEEADAFTDSDIQLSQRLKDIKQEDEIGQLAESIFRMENDIQRYVKNLTLVTAEKERIGAELDVATQIQQSMLPCLFPAFPEQEEFDVYAIMDPAKEVGGDFYDFFMLDDTHVAIVVADVSGKGVPAALFMVIGKTLIKDHTTADRDLGEVFTEVNDLLCESNAKGLFITAFEGVLDLVTGEFRYVNAGHETPFIARKGEDFLPYKVRAGFVLAGMEGIRYKAGVLQLEEGDRIFQYSDGVTEATNLRNELYGMDRLNNALNENKDLPIDHLLLTVRKDIDTFVGEAPQFDDITMLCLEYKKKMTVEDKDGESSDVD